MDAVTFQIREDRVVKGWAFGPQDGEAIYEVWRCNREHGTECLLAEATTRTEASELMRRYAAEEQARKAAQ